MKKSILLIHTGGTIGMGRGPGTGVLEPDTFLNNLKTSLPQAFELADIRITIPFVIDSSELGFSHLQETAGIIGNYIKELDGIIITHGTDTMAYSASMLSFMLKNIPVPVILTGAQKPLSEIRSDARNNFLSALELALTEITEVAVFFNDRLLRGNRTTKSHINQFNAFDSPNYPPLARVGIDLEVYDKNILKPSGPFSLWTKLDNSIAVYKVFPECDPDNFNPQPHTRAIVLIGYGAGTIPLKGKKLLEKISSWLKTGKLVILMSETKSGRLDPRLYESGSRIMEMGALDSGDMTFEAAVCKLMFLLGKYQKNDMVSREFKVSLAGEIT